MGKIKNTTPDTAAADSLLRSRRVLENIAVIGMLLIAISLIIPLFNLTSGEWLGALKWVYGAGALTYLVARVIGAIKNSPDDSTRLRRLRRMPAWAGVAFCIAAWVWFYSEARLGELAGPLAILRQTIMFSLVGALLQIISSWMIYSRENKEKNG